MRTRNLKPGFFKNNKLGKLPPLARLLYAGLWCYADKHGCFKWEPERIKIEILPYDKCDIEKLLSELLKSGFLLLYENNKHRYGHIPTFLDHQSPHPKEQNSKIPIPSEESLKFQEISGNFREFNGTLLGTVGEGREGREGNIGEGKKEEQKFDRFWQAYPKKKSKGQAEKAFAKINPDEQLLATMVATIKRATKSEDWQKENGKYIPHPATWLNAKGWEDVFQEVVAPISIAQNKNPPCVKCGNPGIYPYGNTDKWYCTKCWPKRTENLGEIGKHIGNVAKLMPGTETQDREERIAELRKQGETTKEATK